MQIDDKKYQIAFNNYKNGLNKDSNNTQHFV